MSKALNTVTFGLAGKDKSSRERRRDAVRRGQAPDPKTGATSTRIPFPGKPGDPRHRAQVGASYGGGGTMLATADRVGGRRGTSLRSTRGRRRGPTVINELENLG